MQVCDEGGLHDANTPDDNSPGALLLDLRESGGIYAFNHRRSKRHTLPSEHEHNKICAFLDTATPRTYIANMALLAAQVHSLYVSSR